MKGIHRIIRLENTYVSVAARIWEEGIIQQRVLIYFISRCLFYSCIIRLSIVGDIISSRIQQRQQLSKIVFIITTNVFSNVVSLEYLGQQRIYGTGFIIAANLFSIFIVILIIVAFIWISYYAEGYTMELIMFLYVLGNESGIL